MCGRGCGRARGAGVKVKREGHGDKNEMVYSDTTSTVLYSCNTKSCMENMKKTNKQT